MSVQMVILVFLGGMRPYLERREKGRGAGEVFKMVTGFSGLVLPALSAETHVKQTVPAPYVAQPFLKAKVRGAAPCLVWEPLLPPEDVSPLGLGLGGVCRLRAPALQVSGRRR